MDFETPSRVEAQNRVIGCECGAVGEADGGFIGDSSADGCAALGVDDHVHVAGLSDGVHVELGTKGMAMYSDLRRLEGLYSW